MPISAKSVLLGVAAMAIAAAIPASAQQRQLFYAWAPKPSVPTPWTAPNKPVWRYAEIVAAHKGQKSWVQPIVRDHDYSADYIQMAPGEKTRTQFWADDPVFWWIADGQVRFHIQGQQPFVASKGFMVQVPYRTPYSMETVGDAPSVRFEVRRAGRTPLYPVADKANPGPAPKADGKTYVLSRYTNTPNPYGDHKPYLDFIKDYVKNPNAPTAHFRFVEDDDNFMNIIRGHGMPTPPDSDKGHFHIDYNEFWVIAEGSMDYKMEGMKVFTAHVNDIVYAPQGRWHRASWAGDGMSTRIAINPRREGMHNYDVKPD
ncbi:MAG: cupin domain-containing protein [Alphaproteobacteria bacterium]|nr:cupin domain-containing protein [Alphaproteobacteria bacterium]